MGDANIYNSCFSCCILSYLIFEIIFKLLIIECDIIRCLFFCEENKKKTKVTVESYYSCTREMFLRLMNSHTYGINPNCSWVWTFTVVVWTFLHLHLSYEMFSQVMEKSIGFFCFFFHCVKKMRAFTFYLEWNDLGDKLLKIGTF